MTVSRRAFLAGSGAVLAAAGAGTAIGLHQSGTSARAATRSGGTHTLVLIGMYGGNDGLNTVIPYLDPAYRQGRPDLGYSPVEVIPLDTSLALNPSLKGFKTLWDTKQLAIVRGVGYPNPNYSHFRSMDIWQSGVPDRQEATGWLGRWLDRISPDPLTAISIGPTLPKLLRGAKSAGSSIPAGSVSLPATADGPYQALMRPRPGLAGQIAQSGADLLTVMHAVQKVLNTTPAAAPAQPGLAHDLDTVARLIKGGLPTRVYVVSAPGYDTHINEKANQERLLADLDAAVTGFVHAMASHPGVVVMTFSEFGRRVAQNASAGTDHGSAAPLFVAGTGVKGGYYGDEPSLTDLDDGNLRFSTDFRSVYATVLSRVIGTDPTPILGKAFPQLEFV